MWYKSINMAFKMPQFRWNQSDVNLYLSRRTLNMNKKPNNLQSKVIVLTHWAAHQIKANVYGLRSILFVDLTFFWAAFYIVWCAEFYINWPDMFCFRWAKTNVPGGSTSCIEVNFMCVRSTDITHLLDKEQLKCICFNVKWWDWRNTMTLFMLRAEEIYA